MSVLATMVFNTTKGKVISTTKKITEPSNSWEAALNPFPIKTKFYSSSGSLSSVTLSSVAKLLSTI
eukprot:scaffold72493_cov22-Cyclotella_meneghiniana.AAC.1